LKIGAVFWIKNMVISNLDYLKVITGDNEVEGGITAVARATSSANGNLFSKNFVTTYALVVSGEFKFR